MFRASPDSPSPIIRGGWNSPGITTPADLADLAALGIQILDEDEPPVEQNLTTVPAWSTSATSPDNRKSISHNVDLGAKSDWRRSTQSPAFGMAPRLTVEDRPGPLTRLNGESRTTLPSGLTRLPPGLPFPNPSAQQTDQFHPKGVDWTSTFLATQSSVDVVPSLTELELQAAPAPSQYNDLRLSEDNAVTVSYEQVPRDTIEERLRMYLPRENLKNGVPTSRTTRTIIEPKVHEEDHIQLPGYETANSSRPPIGPFVERLGYSLVRQPEHDSHGYDVNTPSRQFVDVIDERLKRYDCLSPRNDGQQGWDLLDDRGRKYGEGDRSKFSTDPGVQNRDAHNQSELQLLRSSVRERLRQYDLETNYRKSELGLTDHPEGHASPEHQEHDPIKTQFFEDGIKTSSVSYLRQSNAALAAQGQALTRKASSPASFTIEVKGNRDLPSIYPPAPAYLMSDGGWNGSLEHHYLNFSGHRHTNLDSRSAEENDWYEVEVDARGSGTTMDTSRLDVSVEGVTRDVSVMGVAEDIFAGDRVDQEQTRQKPKAIDKWKTLAANPVPEDNPALAAERNRLLANPKAGSIFRQSFQYVPVTRGIYDNPEKTVESNESESQTPGAKRFSSQGARVNFGLLAPPSIIPSTYVPTSPRMATRGTPPRIYRPVPVTMQARNLSRPPIAPPPQTVPVTSPFSRESLIPQSSPMLGTSSFSRHMELQQYSPKSVKSPALRQQGMLPPPKLDYSGRFAPDQFSPSNPRPLSPPAKAVGHKVSGQGKRGSNENRGALAPVNGEGVNGRRGGSYRKFSPGGLNPRLIGFYPPPPQRLSIAPQVWFMMSIKLNDGSEFPFKVYKQGTSAELPDEFSHRLELLAARFGISEEAKRAAHDTFREYFEN
ncbi:hypothetical protein HDU93_005581 [Gonapodya sp. JEL0774]|nr:hypothetical protein HDU93_005581 [Gonapodya sp. JEL0774]